MALTCLLDTSVWNRLDRAPTIAAEVTVLLSHGEVGYTDIERLEVLRSARYVDHYQRLTVMFAALPRVALTEAALLRAGQVQEQLVQRGHHRGVKIPDLLTAAAAEEAGVQVLHYDHDYDLISSITGQNTACRRKGVRIIAAFLDHHPSGGPLPPRCATGHSAADPEHLFGHRHTADQR